MAEKKKKKSAAEGDGTQEKEHKKNWREVYATPEDIKTFLSGHVYLRYNMVKGWVEARIPPDDAFCVNSELAQFVRDDWQPMSERLRNTLRNALYSVKPVCKTDLDLVIDSGYVPAYHPFIYYLNRLPRAASRSRPCSTRCSGSGSWRWWRAGSTTR